MTQKLAVILAATVAASAFLGAGMTTAQAKNGRNAALIGGIAAGLIGAIAARQGHASPVDSEPVYGGGAPAYQECWTEKRPRYDRWGEFRGYRYLRICN